MLRIQDCRSLLNITTRHTINEYLKDFNYFGRETLTWEEFRRLLELQTFRGLKPGSNSKTEFFGYSQDELKGIFATNAIDIEEKLRMLKQKHASNIVAIVQSSDRQKSRKKETLAPAAVARNGNEV